MEAIYEELESTVEGVETTEVDSAEVEMRVRGHLELVRRLAWKYRWTGLSLEELMSEGNVGLVEAARRFEERGVPFGAYAQQWIRARIRAYVSRTWSMAGGRAPWIVFQLRRERARLEARWGEGHPEVTKRLAEALGKKEEDVVRGTDALAKDVSLNAPLGLEGDVTRLDMLESDEDSAEEQADRGAWAEKLHQSVAAAWPELDARERALVKERMLVEDGVSAEFLAKRFGVTAVRIRQIEQGLRQKLRQRLTAGCTAWDSEAPRLAA
ncbi:sigma-70 family RNA polymerase sigma factor [Corallococcus sp. AB018]|uniref:sigma-70 family RNA polymerase sigma factor n=1 Tax=Corallococcus TaxID=83461 RepID=UPI000F892E6F|nr:MULTISPECIES: sigma-70 family RNA polymerase sigma factor [Corallococcus]NRD55771.1 sigma-70 family RNA polymerase sigma factor [Corallococcus exiguus]RUO89449.1 sigma-70 family RNA polymerase sigma factor [Corallococcus sp. AB018]